MKKEIIQHALHQYILDRKICGASYAFLSEGKAELYYDGEVGCIAPYQKPVKAGYCYDLASLTKVIGTTTRVLQLIDAGTLSFDTKVSEILPRFQGEHVTVKDLLLHCSGLPSDLTDKASLTKDNIADRIYACAVGEQHEVCYSDIGYIILGWIIEAVDRESLENVFQKHIFHPLNMKDTSYICDDAHLYIPTEITIERGCICKEAHDRKAHILGQSGSAGLFSTLEDLVRFAKAILREEECLFTSHMFARLKTEIYQGRGLGWEKPYGEQILYHTGFSGTSILLDTRNHTGFILLTNRIHPNRYQTDFLEFRKQLNRMYLEGV